MTGPMLWLGVQVMVGLGALLVPILAIVVPLSVVRRRWW